MDGVRKTKKTYMKTTGVTDKIRTGHMTGHKLNCISHAVCVINPLQFRRNVARSWIILQGHLETVTFPRLWEYVILGSPHTHTHFINYIYAHK